MTLDLGTFKNTSGKIHHVRDETEIEWTLPNFSRLSGKVDDHYDSPCFAHANSVIFLRIYPHGQKHFERWIGLYQVQWEGGEMNAWWGDMTLMLVDGTQAWPAGIEGHITRCKFGLCSKPMWGASRLVERMELLRRHSEFLPGDALTVRCSITLKKKIAAVSLFDRLLNAGRNLLEIVRNKIPTDVVLNFNEGGRVQEIPVHGAVLKTRSEVFQNMLRHGMKEGRTGKVEIADVRADVFQQVLSYMYTGRARVTDRDARPLYVVADKYQLAELKALCATYMEENLRDATFCDAYEIASTYDEPELMRLAEVYMRDHYALVIETKEWKKLQRENAAEALRLLTDAIRAERKRKGTCDTSSDSD